MNEDWPRLGWKRVLPLSQVMSAHEKSTSHLWRLRECFISSNVREG